MVHERSDSVVCHEDAGGENDAAELVRRCQYALSALPSLSVNPADAVQEEAPGRAGAPGADDATQALEFLRRLVLGEAGAAADGAAVDAATVAALDEGLFESLITRLPALSWAGRKEAVLVWSCLLPHIPGSGADVTADVGDAAAPREGSGNDAAAVGAAAQGPMPGLLLMERRLDLVDSLVLGYTSNNDLAIHSGLMLRETLRSECITRHILEHGMETVVRACDVPNFDVATDAFTTLKDLLRRHKKPVAQFLDQNFADFFLLFHDLLLSDTYVTRRQALKLLGELLLDRANMSIMLRYVSEKEHLKIIMTLLKDKTKSIQLEAFHIFKIFVANPKRPEAITKVLRRNREKLLKFLKDFSSDKEEEDFEEEKEMLISQLEELE